MTNCLPTGVLLAAGRGRRMNGAKQFHPWPTAEGEKPLVAAAFDAISPACAQMVVVLGHRAEEVQAVLEPREFSSCESDPDAPMFASVQAGITKALELHSDAPILLHPADHPEVKPATLRTTLELTRRYPELVLIPNYQGRGGHPTLIPNAIARVLLTSDCPDGLGKYWAQHPEHCMRFQIEDASVVRDVDTPSGM